MKNKALIFAAAAALVLSLAACGGQGGTDSHRVTGSGGTTSGDTAGGGTGGAAGNNGASGSVGSGVRSAVDDAGRAVDDLVDDVTGTHRTGKANMTSFEKMLDNARVHDVDGVLTDGENANW